jgi:acetyl-CoA acetyltransferase
MSEAFERRSFISGIGISRVGRRTGLSGIELTVSAARAAIADAGLLPADIDGLATVGDTSRAAVQDALGLRLGWGVTADSAEDGNASGAQLGPVINAAMAVASGLVRHVLVYRTVQMKGGALSLSGPVSGVKEWMLPFHEYSAVNMAAMVARRHMHNYGTTREQLGWIALTARRHAAFNEHAVYRSPMSMADYLAARPISQPLGVYDCDVPVDGSVALIVSAADHQPGCPNPVVRIVAVCTALRGRPSWDQGEDYPRWAAWDAAAQMWSRTDLKPNDVTVAEVYDGFTILTLDWLEALGFCGMGESGSFAEGGANIGLGGALPLNTYGGQLSAGRLHGYWLLHEACLQIRGQAGARQVDGADVAVAAAGGGPLAGCLLLTR